ncbi:MAG: hypothetical protein BMS9Abin13_452 [Patescibacteria group bacterium]|nr:MAG: hypothetical protein BMS9Abin13_452 [Patescibacteria group bacterium]
MFYQKYKIILAAAFFTVLLPMVSLAAAMSSSNYSIPSSIIGPGGVPITSTSTNYTVEYSSGDESTYTTAACNDNADNDGDGLTDYPNDPGCSSSSDTDETDAETASGGGIIGISGGWSVPSHINAFNVPLAILPTQSGTLTQNVAAGEVILDVLKNNITSRVTFIIIEEPLSPANARLASVNTSLINSAFYDVSAKEQDGNPVTSFPQPITISFPIPESLISASDLGVYWLAPPEAGLDESAGTWVLIQDAVFDLEGRRAVFQVDHLTKFAIFGTVGLPETIPVLLAKVPPISQQASTLEAAADIAVPSVSPEPEALPSAEREALPQEQLLDIGLKLDDPSIVDIGELVARVAFTNSGETPIPVDILFTIVDEAGTSVYSEKYHVVVENEEVLTKNFEIDLAPGEYTVLLTTLYGADILDEFRQDFEIKGEKQLPLLNTRTLILLIGAVVVFYIIFWKRRKREDEEI